MLEKPRLKEHYSAFLVGAEGVLLLSDQEDHALRGPVYGQLLPLLDGRKTSRELVERLQGERERVEILYALWQLEQRGCLVEAVDREVRSSERSSTHHRAAARGMATGGAARRIAVSSIGEVSRAEWAARLQDLGFVSDEGLGLSVVLTDSYLRTDLAERNRLALRTGRPWLLIKPTPPVVWVGPLFRPGASACWQCMVDRLRRNRPFEYCLIRQPDSARPLSHPSNNAAAIEPAITALTRELGILVGHSGADDLVNTIVSIDTNNDSEERHHLTRRPQCPACGAATLYSAQCSPSCTLRGRLTRFTDGGAYRARSSEETLVDWECLSDPLVGVVHDLKPLPMDDAVSSHVYVSRYGSDPAWGVPRLLESGLERASGKGWRDAQARVSAIGEAIERYSAVFQGDEPRIIASLEQLDESAIHPNLCTLFSQTQYESREEWNRRHPERHRVPLPLDPTTRIEWTPVWSLSREKRRYLPTMLLYSGYPDQQGLAFCPADPNGGAAGNSREEALLQGVLELIERDSLALWWYNRVSRPEVDLAAIGHELPVSLIERYRSRGRDLWVLDLTSDLEIPCFAAVSRRTDFWREAIVLGFGAHLDASIAFTRALLELDQVLAHVRAAERSGALSRTLDQWLRDATVANQPYLVPAALPRTRLDELPRLAADDVAENIEICERLLKRHELELFVLDQTRPDIGVPVMKAVVPGLRPFQARFAQGRLYTAPVRSGWLAQARQEDEMNPIGFFL